MNTVQTAADDVRVDERAYDDESLLILDIGFVENDGVTVETVGKTAIIVKNKQTVAELALTSGDVTVKSNNGVLTIVQ